MEDEGSILSNQIKRAKIARLLLLAAVVDQELSESEVRNRVARWLDRVLDNRREFLFDLGWMESVESNMHSLHQLNFVARHHSAVKYGITEIGRAHLDANIKELEEFLGISLKVLTEV